MFATLEVFMRPKVSSGMNSSTESRPIDTPGRRLMLARIAPLQRHPVQVNAGLSPGAVNKALIKKLGIEKEVEHLRTQSAEYAQAARKAMAEYVAAQKLNPAKSVLESSAHLLNHVDYRGKGRAVPRTGMALHTWDPAPPAPPVPDSRWLPPDTFYHDCVVSGQGVGDGVEWPWISDDGTRGQECLIEWMFEFYPAGNEVYTLSSTTIAAGLYSVYANTDWYDSHNAYVDIYASMQIDQTLPGPVQVGDIQVTSVSASAHDDLFQIDSQNIKDSGPFFAAGKLEASLFLFAGSLVNVSVLVYVTALARGNTSYVGLDLARPTGVVACLGLNVDGY